MPNVILSPSAAEALWYIFYLLCATAITVAGYKIKTYPLVKKALTEAKLADDTITGTQWKRFQDEIDRLIGRINKLEDRCGALEREVEECQRREQAAERRAAEAEAENMRLNALLLGTGQARQEDALIEAAERIVERDRKKKP